MIHVLLAINVITGVIIDHANRQKLYLRSVEICQVSETVVSFLKIALIWVLAHESLNYDGCLFPVCELRAGPSPLSRDVRRLHDVLLAQHPLPSQETRHGQ